MTDTPYDKYPSIVLFSWEWAEELDPVILLPSTVYSTETGIEVAKFGTPSGTKLPMI